MISLAMKLSIVIPCFNESANIPLLLEKFSRVLVHHDAELILVNNGSTDDSAEILKKLLPQYSFSVCVDVPVNKGYGFGILSGLAQAKGTYLGWTHADLQTDPADISKALALIEQADNPETLYIKGNRNGRPLLDQLFTWGMSLFELLCLKSFLWDINAQPNIFHRTFFESWKNPPHDFSLDLFALLQAKQKDLKIIRFNVRFSKRLHGQSSWNTSLASKWKFIKRTVLFSLQLKKELKHGTRRASN